MSSEAVELARQTGNPTALAYALDGRAASIAAPDTVAECLALATELRGVAEQSGDAEQVVQGTFTGSWRSFKLEISVGRRSISPRRAASPTSSGSLLSSGR